MAASIYFFLRALITLQNLQLIVVQRWGFEPEVPTFFRYTRDMHNNDCMRVFIY